MRCLCTRSAPRLTSCVRCRSQRLRDQGLVHGCKLHGPQGGGHGRGLWPLRLLAGRHGGRRHRQAFRGCPLRPHPRPQIGPLRRTLCRPGASVPPRVESRCPETEHPQCTTCVSRLFWRSGSRICGCSPLLVPLPLTAAPYKRLQTHKRETENQTRTRGESSGVGPGPPQYEKEAVSANKAVAGKTRPRAPLPC